MDYRQIIKSSLVGCGVGILVFFVLGMLGEYTFSVYHLFIDLPDEVLKTFGYYRFDQNEFLLMLYWFTLWSAIGILFSAIYNRSFKTAVYLLMFLVLLVVTVMFFLKPSLLNSTFVCSFFGDSSYTESPEKRCYVEVATNRKDVNICEKVLSPSSDVYLSQYGQNWYDLCKANVNRNQSRNPWSGSFTVDI